MRKKKLIKGMMAVAIVAVAGLAIYANQPKEEMTDVMLTNVEALARCEITKGGTTVKFECKGAGTCTKTALGHTLTCDGTEVKINID